MSLFNLFSNNLSQDDFAPLAMQALEASGCRAGLHYNQERFAIDIEANGEPSHRWYLYSVFEQYRSANRKDKREILLNNAKRMATLPAGSIPSKYIDAKNNIFPDIKEPIIWESARLEKLLSGQVFDGLAFRYIVNELAIVLTYETETTKLIIKNKHLKKWKISFEDVCRDALENLRAISPRVFKSVTPGVYTSMWNDGYDPARLFLLDVFEELPLQGLPVIAIPNNNTLLVAGSNDAEGLNNLASHAGNILQNEPNPLSGYFLLLDDAGISVYPPTGDTNAVELGKINVHWTADIYAQQKLILERLLPSVDTDISIAPFEIISPADSETVLSMSVITEGNDNLIPKTDFICFQRQDADIYALVSWVLAMEIAGEIFDKTTYIPARFRVSQFPNDKQFDEMLLRMEYDIEDSDVCWLV